MIKKIDKDTFEIITETKETVSLSQLEAELENLEKENKKIELLELQIAKLPENIRQYIQLPTYHDVEIKQLKEKINILKQI